MGDWKSRAQRASTDLALCEARAQDIKVVASLPSPRTQEPRTTPAAHVGLSEGHAIGARGEPPATRSRRTGANDPMLGCLLLLMRALRRQVPAAILLEGLPMERQGLTLQLLGVAAARAGLSLQLVKRELDSIPDKSLPAILLLGKKRSCVLLQRCEHGRLFIAVPGWGGGNQEVSREELLSQYSGYAMLADPQAEAPVDAESTLRTWSGEAIRSSWRRCWERLWASLVRGYACAAGGRLKTSPVQMDSASDCEVPPAGGGIAPDELAGQHCRVGCSDTAVVSQPTQPTQQNVDVVIYVK